MFPQRATALVQEYGWHLGLPVRRILRLCGLNVERQWTGVFAEMAMSSCSMGLSSHMAIQLVALYGVARCATIFRRCYWYFLPIGGLTLLTLCCGPCGAGGSTLVDVVSSLLVPRLSVALLLGRILQCYFAHFEMWCDRWRDVSVPLRPSLWRAASRSSWGGREILCTLPRMHLAVRRPSGRCVTTRSCAHLGCLCAGLDLLPYSFYGFLFALYFYTYVSSMPRGVTTTVPNCN